MCSAEQTLVLVDLDARRPAPIEAIYREAIEKFEGADLETAASG